MDDCIQSQLMTTIRTKENYFFGWKPMVGLSDCEIERQIQQVHS
jgi:hypothetical protein